MEFNSGFKGLMTCPTQRFHPCPCFFLGWGDGDSRTPDRVFHVQGDLMEKFSVFWSWILWCPMMPVLFPQFPRGVTWTRVQLKGSYRRVSPLARASVRVGGMVWCTRVCATGR